jgi:hypothetical protein
METRRDTLEDLTRLARTPFQTEKGPNNDYCERIERMEYLNSTESYCPDAD